MPLQFAGITTEHLAVRGAVGVFDVSHMGQIETSGDDAVEFLQRLLSNDVTRLEVGGAQYSVLCRDDGGVLDDLFTYRLAAHRFLTVTNASNHFRDLAWLRSHAGAYDVSIEDRQLEYAMLAVQGPQARRALEPLVAGALPERLRIAEVAVAGQSAMVAGTGYTGEEGFEIMVAPEAASSVWDALCDAGVAPAGLGARDTLRLEACFHLYGNDLMETRGPIEAGLGWCCRESTGFIGADAVASVRSGGATELLVPFVMADGGIARPGNPVIGGGEVTSGTMSPCLRLGVGMAYVPTRVAAEGTALHIDVRGQERRAVIASKPIYSGRTS